AVIMHEYILRLWFTTASTLSDTSHVEIYSLSLHDALPILIMRGADQDEVIQYLASLGVEFKDDGERRSFFDNIAGIVNNTRHFRSEERRVGKECKSRR